MSDTLNLTTMAMQFFTEMCHAGFALDRDELNEKVWYKVVNGERQVGLVEMRIVDNLLSDGLVEYTNEKHTAVQLTERGRRWCAELNK